MAALLIASPQARRRQHVEHQDYQVEQQIPHYDGHGQDLGNKRVKFVDRQQMKCQKLSLSLIRIDLSSR